MLAAELKDLSVIWLVELVAAGARCACVKTAAKSSHLFSWVFSQWWQFHFALTQKTQPSLNAWIAGYLLLGVGGGSYTHLSSSKYKANNRQLMRGIDASLKSEISHATSPQHCSMCA